MRKSLGNYLTLFLIIGLAGFLLVLFASGHESATKTLFGAGKLIYPAKSAVIKIDGIESNDSQIFESDGRFYFVNDNPKIRSIDLLIIDRTKNDVALPNGGCRDVIFSNYLFLADCGYGGVFYGNKAKMEGFDTKLEINDSRMKFILPSDKNSDPSEHKIEILFKSE